MNGPNAPRELSPAALILGVGLSVVLSAAIAYLGLRVGMTVAAAIPAAVIGMAILNGVMKRTSILEANIVQTAASAGESLAAGVIFTIPALIRAGIWDRFEYWTTTLIALAGGLLGALFMIPMRRVFIVENRELQYPEGVACAEVLRAGEQALSAKGATGGARAIVWGMIVGAGIKACEALFGLLAATVKWATIRGGRPTYAGVEISPSLVAVGVIVGLPIAVQILLGGLLGNQFLLPFVADRALVLNPGELTTAQVVDQIFKTQVRYAGVGAMVVGGLLSIWRVRSSLGAAVRELTRQFRKGERGAEIIETERNLSGRTIGILLLLAISAVGVLYYTLLKSLPVALLTVVVMTVMAFFLTAVAAYIVGLVGSSNSPVSGMTITALLATAAMIALFKKLGLITVSPDEAILATLGVAAVVCCVASCAGDMCNDLKTGYMVGASPRKQQIAELLAITASAMVLAPVLNVIHEGSLKAGTEGIGGKAFPAPQSQLFSDLAVGFFGDGRLPWNMVVWGVAIGVALAIGDLFLARRGSAFRLHVMPVAIGIYLPFGICVPIVLGGLIHFALSRRKSNPSAVGRETLVASGVIAGESLLGFGTALMAYLDYKALGLAEVWNIGSGTVEIASLITLALFGAWLYVYSTKEPPT